MFELALREIAWDARGRWCGEGQVLGLPRPELAVPHQCHPMRLAECGTFLCSACRRLVPWCLGGSDDNKTDATSCDDCWCKRRGLHHG